MHLAVVGRNHNRRPGRQPVEEFGHHGVAGRQLVVVTLGQPELVGRPVDVVPVGVDERFLSCESA